MGKRRKRMDQVTRGDDKAAHSEEDDLEVSTSDSNQEK